MLQEYFSKKYIRTTIMEISTFIARVIVDYYHIKRPLLVFLDDSDDVKYQFGNLVAPLVDLAYPNWLIFFREETEIENFFNDIYIPFDCTFMISKVNNQDNETINAEIIWEAYQIDRGKELRSGIFAKWNSETGIQLPKYSLYQRRNNLYGHQLRVTSIEDPPSSILVRNEVNEIIGLKGFFGGVIDLLKEGMNCTIKYQSTNEWGYLTANGTWTGGISSLIDKNSDIFAGELMMTTDRLNAITFTTPLYSTKCRTYIKRPSTSALKWDAYAIPFAGGIWSAIGIIILVTGGVMSGMKSFASIFRELNNMIGDEPISFLNTIFTVFGALCSQGIASSLHDPIRIVHVSIHVTGVVLMAAYSAALISSLAVKTFVMPFTTMEGLVKDGTYRFGVVGASADFTFFRNTSDKVMSVLFEKVLVKEKNLPMNYFEGLTRVCNEDKYAFMTLDNVVSQLQSSVNCVVMPLNVISQTSISMALQPHSPYRGLIDNNILLLRDSGILQRLLNAKWALTGDNVESAWSTVEITDVVPLIIVLIGGFFMSFILLASERLFYIKSKKFKRKKNKKRLVANGKTSMLNKIQY
ncbi:hypothetical protein PV326_004031 [Microctonus aethiopoides]|nr:hypothetical protein PV326_004031 [Microctonus aethiopoides]